jgi:hypothetical protein
MRSVVRSALRVSAVSALWTSVASATAIVVGLAEASLALVAFGVVQLFDFAADVPPLRSSSRLARWPWASRRRVNSEWSDLQLGALRSALHWAL